MDRDDLDMILSSMERVLQDAPLEEIDREGGVGAKADALWAALEENGFTRLCASEAHGGFGAGLSDALPLITLCGRHAVAAPVADTILANALLSAAGVEPPAGRIAVAEAGASRVPHAGQCSAVLSLRDGKLALAALPAGAAKPGFKTEDGAGAVDLAALETLAEAAAPNWLDDAALRSLGALTRAALMSGAMDAVLNITLEYTAGREQFGRPLSKFQAIQHHLSDMACEAAACAAATSLAGDALSQDPTLKGAAAQDLAVAKIRCGGAATRVAASAHQAHGAMGYTREYALGRFTRRLWQWQDEFGSDAEWSTQLGRALLAQPSADFWPTLTA